MHEGVESAIGSRERELAFENPELHRRAQILFQAKSFDHVGIVRRGDFLKESLYHECSMLRLTDWTSRDGARLGAVRRARGQSCTLREAHLAAEKHECTANCEATKHSTDEIVRREFRGRVARQLTGMVSWCVAQVPVWVCGRIPRPTDKLFQVQPVEGRSI